jgi:hypothetical protein
MRKERRLSDLEKVLIKTLYPRGYSIGKLADLLGRRKNVIHYHTSKIFGPKYRKIEFNSSLEEDLGEFLGAFAGDGHLAIHKKNWQYKILIYLSANEGEYARYLSALTKRLFNKEAHVRKLPNRSVTEVRIYGRALIEVLRKYLSFESDKTYTVRLKKNQSSYRIPFLKGFVRGLIASDGGVGSGVVYFSTISKKLAYQLSDILNGFSILNHVYPQERVKPRRMMYRVRIYGIDNLKRFYNFVGLNEENKLNKLKSFLDEYYQH